MFAIASFQSEIFRVLLKLVGRKRFMLKTGDDLRKGIEKRRKLRFEPPEKLAKQMNVEKFQLGAHSYYVLKPHSSSPEKHVLYLHGGAYIHRITRYHWNFLRRLMDEIDCTITVPLYPLAPEHTNKDTFAFLDRLYDEHIARHILLSNELIFMGDSAGGGLALAFAQYLRDERRNIQPKKILMNAPWLDLTVSNPEMDEIDARDPFLAKPAMIEAANMYAGGEDLKNPLLSPIYGNLTNLSDMMLIIGTDDMLLADARKFKRVAEQQKVPLEYREYERMVHVFPLFPFPEGKQGLHDIVTFIKK